MILLALPIVIAVFFVILLIVLIIVLIIEFRRNRSRYRYEDDGGIQINAEEVAETYMRLLEPVTFNKEESKYNDCSICLKEFEEGEGQLQRIPNCQHVFHETCLRKWFLQAQICPMCRGNIIKMPSSSGEAVPEQADIEVQHVSVLESEESQ